MTQHTQGPWTIRHGRCIYGSGDLIKPFIASVEDDHNDLETAANARLIAAAPEMLSMLYAVLNLLNDPDADSFDAVRIEREILKVIDKATGGEQ